MEIEKDSSVFIQGGQTHRVTAYCVDNSTGDKQGVSVELMGTVTQLQVISGILSALVIFGLLTLFLRWAARRLNTPWEKLFQPSVRILLRSDGFSRPMSDYCRSTIKSSNPTLRLRSLPDGFSS